MNERIKALMWDAGLNSNYVEGIDSIYSTQLEKFAESIVRQCGFELVDESLQYHSPLIQAFTVKVANRLKARFGLYDEQGGQSGWTNE